MISSILKRRGNWNTYNERQVFIVDLRLPWKVGSILPSTLDAVGSVLGRGTYGVKEVCELRDPPPPQAFSIRDLGGRVESIFGCTWPVHCGGFQGHCLVGGWRGHAHPSLRLCLSAHIVLVLVEGWT